MVVSPGHSSFSFLISSSLSFSLSFENTVSISYHHDTQTLKIAAINVYVVNRNQPNGVSEIKYTLPFPLTLFGLTFKETLSHLSIHLFILWLQTT